MARYFLLVASDAETISGKKRGGLEIAKQRLQQGYWPFYANTRYRSAIRPGNTCCVYVAGRQEFHGCIFADAAVDSVSHERSALHALENDLLASGIPASVLQLAQQRTYPKPVNLRGILDDLSFAPKRQTNKWGAVLQGGCRSLTEDDYRLILRCSGLA